MRKLFAAIVVIGLSTLFGCACNDTSAGWFGSTSYTKCNMGCLEGKSCGCTAGCPCHAKGCKGGCSPCKR